MSLIIDGSSVIRVLGRENPRVEILSAALEHFDSQAISFTVFLDAWLISSTGRIDSDQRNLLERLIEEYSAFVERGTGGQKADEPLLTFANHNPETLILSRDLYREYWGRFPWLKGSGRLLQFNYVNAAGQLIIPGLDMVIKVRPFGGPAPNEKPDPRSIINTSKEQSMDPDKPFPGQPAEPRGAGMADIVFCLDRTGSMQPCIDAVKTSIVGFVKNDLQTAGDVDFRLRLIAYGDLISTSGVHKQDKAWLCTEFTDDVNQFSADLGAVFASGGGPGTKESTLDAIYLAIKSRWRAKVHRAIIVFTDEDTYTDLSPSTARHAGQDGVSFIVQQLQLLRSFKLFLVAPHCEAYQRINTAVRSADRQVQWMKLKTVAEGRIDTRRVDWARFLSDIGRDVSSTASRAKPTF